MKTILTLLLACLATTLLAQETTETYKQDFTTGKGEWTIRNVNLPSSLKYVWQHATSSNGAYMKASAYKGEAYPSESWLISPAIDLTKATTATISIYQAMHYGKDGLYIRITTDNTNWDSITVSPMPSGSSWTFVNSTADISAYAGDTIKIAFVYTSTIDIAPTWEVQTVTINTTSKQQETSCRYQSLEGYTSTELLQQLHNTISDHTVLPYINVRADNAKVDIDDDGYVNDMYAGCTFLPSDYCRDIQDVPDCSCYNREHSLPKSFWGGYINEPMYTDLHHVIPTDYNANTKRSAWVYDEVTDTTWTNTFGSKLGIGNTWGETAFEPVDEYKGDIARIYFYMVTCYLHKNFTLGGKGYRYFTFNDSTAGFTISALNLLLKWHRQDAVSSQERTRNERVANIQGNRNPFVDEPNLVEFIWGTMRGEDFACNAEIKQPDSTQVDGAITCAEARTRTLALANNTQSTEEYTVVGYVTSAKSYDNSYHSQTFWMSDERDKRQVFYAYQCNNATEAVSVGYKVAITGKLLNYNGTPEMKWGQTRILDRSTDLIYTTPDTEKDIQTILSQDPTARIYTITGTPVTNPSNDLPSGIYIIHTNSTTHKLLIP